MGNWKTVNMLGHMNKSDAKDVIRTLSDKNGWDTPAECFTMVRSICGLNQWIDADGIINVSGNLAERDYDNDDIENGLQFLAERYPSLEMVLHSGSDWESLVCSATFHVKNGVVTRLEPEIVALEPVRMLPIIFSQ